MFLNKSYAGSLHVVVCSNKGEVFAWGDNDEGQLGDGTVKEVPRPRAIPALQVYSNFIVHSYTILEIEF